MHISIIYTTALILIIGASPIPLPYDYYMLLRIVVTAVFTWAAVIIHEKNNAGLMWLCVGVALLFNPFIKVHLTNDLWAIIDIFIAIFLIGIRKQINSEGTTI